MKAFQEFRAAPAERTGLILLLAEKLIPPGRNHDERSRIDILTSGFQPHSRLPGCWPVAVGACSPLQWRYRPRFSRGSL